MGDAGPGPTGTGRDPRSTDAVVRLGTRSGTGRTTGPAEPAPSSGSVDQGLGLRGQRLEQEGCGPGDPDAVPPDRISETNVLLTWTLSLGDRRTLSTSLQQSSAPADFGGGFQGNVTLQRDLPAGNGLGYRMSLSSSDEQDAYLAYQGRAGIASIDYSRRNGDSGVRVGATGGLAITSAGVMPSRQLNESFAVVQIAGLVARRIVCFTRVGQVLRTGDRFGLIRFGSRLDVYLPDGVEPQVALGQTMVAGETVIADLTRALPARAARSE